MKRRKNKGEWILKNVISKELMEDVYIMKVVTFGEIMLRLKTPENLRIMQSDDFEASYGGAEANVAVSLEMYEDKCAFVSKVPNNPVGMSALSEVRHYGVNTDYLVRGGDRLGIYFFEKK